MEDKKCSYSSLKMEDTKMENFMEDPTAEAVKTKSIRKQLLIMVCSKLQFSLYNNPTNNINAKICEDL